jgi:hypothetical protein
MANEIRSKVAQYAEKYNIPPKIFEGMIRQESGFRPDAIGPPTKYGTAKGLGQLLDSTAKTYGVDDWKDPDQNLNAAAHYLSDLHKNFGSWDLALAGYNAGGGAVRKYGGVPPYRETRNYVKSIMSYAGSEDGDAAVALPQDGAGTARPRRMGSVSAAKSNTMSDTQNAAEEGVSALLRSGIVRDTAAASSDASAGDESLYPDVSETLRQGIRPVVSPTAEPQALQTVRLEPQTREQLQQPHGVPPAPSPSPLQQIAPYSQAPLIAAPLPRPRVPLGNPEIPSAPPEPEVDPRAAALGLLPPQIGIGNRLLVPGVGAVPGGTDVLSQQTKSITQTATGPLKQAINSFAQRTGGGDFIKDLVIRYKTAPLAAKEPILREADAYGLRSTVQRLSQMYGGPSSGLLPSPIA